MPARIDAAVSLEDIAPTIEDMLGLKSKRAHDGRSLWPLLQGRDDAAQSFAERVRFIETEYQMPLGFATEDGKIDPDKIQEAVRIYSIDPDTDRVTVKPSLLKYLLFEREYAAVGPQYLVGAIPNYQGAGFNYLAARLSDGALRRLYSAPSPEEPELLALWDALHSQFGSVLLNRPSVVKTAVANHDRTVPSSVTK